MPKKEYNFKDVIKIKTSDPVVIDGVSEIVMASEKDNDVLTPEEERKLIQVLNENSGIDGRASNKSNKQSSQ